MQATAATDLQTRRCAVPRYFVDFASVDGFYKDDVGGDLPSFDQARDEAVDSLCLMANRQLPDGERRELAVTVRDETGTSLYRATLIFVGKRLSDYHFTRACHNPVEGEDIRQQAVHSARKS